MKRIWLVLVIILLFGAALSSCKNGEESVFADVTSYWKDVERAGTESSRQYVTSQISLLDAAMSEYMALGTKIVETEDSTLVNQYEAQQLYLVVRMRRVAQNIPAGAVPQEVLRLIR